METKKIVKMANKNLKFMDGTTTPVKRILESNDIVFACWQDKLAKNGVSTMLIKGHAKLEAIAYGLDMLDGPLRGDSRYLRVSAVKVNGLLMALAARETLGEAQGNH